MGECGTRRLALVRAVISIRFDVSSALGTMERLLLTAELMTFVLPRNSRPLRFSGDVKAMSPDAKGEPSQGALALGRPRIRKSSPSPPPVDFPDVTTARQPIPKGRRLSTPTPGYLKRPNAESSPLRDNGTRRLERAEPRNGGGLQPIGRERMASVDDEQPTVSMDRDELDVLPGRSARTPRLSTPPPMPAVPHFRPATSAVPMPAFVGAAGTRSSVVTRTRGAPLAIWLLAGALAAIVSFHVTPELIKPLLAPSRSAAQPP